MSNIKILLLSMLLLTVGFIWIISNSNEQYKKIQPVTDAANSIVGNTELNPEYLKNSADITEDTVDPNVA